MIHLFLPWWILAKKDSNAAMRLMHGWKLKSEKSGLVPSLWSNKRSWLPPSSPRQLSKRAGLPRSFVSRTSHAVSTVPSTWPTWNFKLLGKEARWLPSTNFGTKRKNTALDSIVCALKASHKPALQWALAGTVNPAWMTTLAVAQCLSLLSALLPSAMTISQWTMTASALNPFQNPQ